MWAYVGFPLFQNVASLLWIFTFVWVSHLEKLTCLIIRNYVKLIYIFIENDAWKNKAFLIGVGACFTQNS